MKNDNQEALLPSESNAHYAECVDYLVSTMPSQSSPANAHTMNTTSILKEIETQAKKPLEEQLEDLKLAGAKCIQSLDNILQHLNTFDAKDVTCSVDDKEVNCETWEENHY